MSRGAVSFGATARDVLWTAQDGRCWICARQMRRKGSNEPDACTLDHIWPKAKFPGIGDVGVTLLACKSCNAKRGSPKPSDAEVRTLVAVWRKVDRRWLSWNIRAIELDLQALEVKRDRVRLLKMLEAA